MSSREQDAAKQKRALEQRVAELESMVKALTERVTALEAARTVKLPATIRCHCGQPATRRYLSSDPGAPSVFRCDRCNPPADAVQVAAA
jgi:hypothetical protein